MILVLSFLVPLIFALLLGPLVIRIYTKHHWLDDPTKTNHPKVIHTRPLARGGGLVAGIAILASIPFFIPISPLIIGICLSILLLILIGTWDDIADPHPILRLGFQIVAAVIPILFGLTIPYITNPFGGVIVFSQVALISSVLAVVWIVWCMNIVNFSTGLDGQMPGYVAIAALTIAALSTRFFPDPKQHVVFTFSILTAGAYLGFLYWNKFPQKMMAGFGASTLAGFLLAVLSILSGAKLATAMLVLAVPMADAVYVIARRIAHKKSPFWGDRSHLHHALLDRGYSKNQVAMLYWLSAFILGLISLQLTSGQKIFTILLILAIVCMIGTWLRLGLSFFVRSDRDSG